MTGPQAGQNQGYFQSPPRREFLETHFRLRGSQSYFLGL